jgi:hypothetical protein
MGIKSELDVKSDLCQRLLHTFEFRASAVKKSHSVSKFLLLVL